MAYAAACCLGVLLAAGFASQASAATHARQEPDQIGQVAVTDPQLAVVLKQTKAAAGKPRLFHENLVKSRPLVQPDRW